jgi:hypothetical protein
LGIHRHGLAEVAAGHLELPQRVADPGVAVELLGLLTKQGLALGVAARLDQHL